MGATSDSDSDGLEVPIDQAENVRRKRGRNIEENPFEFSESWKKIQKVRIDMRNSKIPKKDLKLPWLRMFPSLKKHALETGFTIEELEVLWDVFTYPSTQITETQRRILLMLLIPNCLIPGNFVQRIVLWAVEAVNSVPEKRGIVATVTVILKYLYGIVEYSLIEGDCFKKPFMYNTLFSLSAHKDLVEWLFLILSKVTTKEVLQLFHVRITSKLWKQPRPVQHKRAVLNVLKLYKLMRPDYMPENVFEIHINAKGSRSKLKEDFRELLLASKRRALALDGRTDDENYSSTAGADTDPSQIFHNSFFPDTCPSFIDHDWKYFCSTAAPANSGVVWALLKPSMLGVFKTNGELLGLLESWLDINFLHKFGRYDKTQNHRYEFILDRCIEISAILGNGLEAVDDWLPEFILMWDMLLWRKKIFKLFAYLNVFEFSEFYDQLLRKLEIDFLHSSVIDSSQVWDALEHLLVRWIRLAISSRIRVDENVEDEEDNPGILKSVSDLYNFMFGLCTKFIAVNIYDGNAEPIILQMINTYKTLAHLFNETRAPFRPVIPEALFYSVILIDTADVFEAFLCYLRTCSADSIDGTRNERDRKILEDMIYNVSNFFSSEKNCCLAGLFRSEFNMLDKKESRILYKKLQTWTAKSSKALEVFATGDHQHELNFNLKAMEQLAPNLYWYASKIPKSVSPTSLSSNSSRATDVTQFNPPYCSTPMPGQNIRM